MQAWAAKYKDNTMIDHKMRCLAALDFTEERARKRILNELWNALCDARTQPHESDKARDALEQYYDFFHEAD